MYDTEMSLRRQRWSGVICLAFAPPALALFIVTLVGLGTIPVTAGLILLSLALPATRTLTNLARRHAAAVLGEPIIAPYRPAAAGNPLTRMAARSKDPQTWRDLLWLFLAGTAGLATAIVMVIPVLGIPWYLIHPFVVSVTGDVFYQDFGLFTVDSTASAFFLWIHLPVYAAMWLLLTPRLVRLRARFDRWLLGPRRDVRVEQLEERVSELAESRSEAVDVQAAELRRIERDLHDGAQARLVASGMTLGLAAEQIKHDPDSARALLEEAQATNVHALQELRSLVRGIHPPVLSDRGLVGAIEALAVDMKLPVDVEADLDGRPPAPVESAAYFAVAECLANAGKHAAATRVTVHVHHTDDTLHLAVEDDGRGGARSDGDGDGGLAGIARRLNAFDGQLTVTSPEGGPTRVAMMVPCELSSAKT